MRVQIAVLAIPVLAMIGCNAEEYKKLNDQVASLTAENQQLKGGRSGNPAQAKRGEATQEPAGSGSEAVSREPTAVKVDERMIIRTGKLQFRTDNIRETRAKIDSVLKDAGGYVSKENSEGSATRMVQELVLRIPSDRYESVVNKITDGAGRLDTRQIEADDVTESFIDTVARLNVKKDVEGRYRKFLTEARTIKDMLTIESQIEVLRSEIESIEGKLRYLQSRVGLGTLNVTIYQEIPGPKQAEPSRWSEAFMAGWNVVVSLAVGAVYIWPFILIAAILLIAARVYNRRKDRNP